MNTPTQQEPTDTIQRYSIVPIRRELKEKAEEAWHEANRRYQADKSTPNYAALVAASLAFEKAKDDYLSVAPLIKHNSGTVAAGEQ